MSDNKWEKPYGSPLEHLRRGIKMIRDKNRKEVCNSLLPRFIPMTTSNKYGCDADLVFYRHKLMEAMSVPPELIRKIND